MSESTTSFDTSILVRLLDHQIVGSDGRFLGKVDDLALRADGDDLVVQALMVGPTALAPRYPGVLGRWGWAIWRRLSDPTDPGAVVVPLEEVRDAESDIEVSDAARAALLASFGLENWLRRHLISRIPGAKGVEEGLDVPGWAGPDRLEVPERGRDDGTHRLTELLTMDVLDHEETPIGRIVDVHGRATGSTGTLGPILLTRVLIGPKHLGSKLGYSTQEQDGPRAIRWLIERVHRSARWHEWSHLTAISWSRGIVHVRERG